ncbi:hypothetical protein GIB67_034047 [Kingdonia uniflora]|uniref:NAB domain-containing protein n=1 Tax=Kingdonia uniflora TaxID=39325 RepID=A0A7J7M6F4_9MAGN|nr:hypothetical protein GIB67_034047 [Kingdonia uniflora]
MAQEVAKTVSVGMGESIVAPTEVEIGMEICPAPMGIRPAPPRMGQIWYELNRYGGGDESEQRTKEMLELLQDEGDTFAARAEMYYKKKPELVRIMEELHRSFRALAERFDPFRIVSKMQRLKLKYFGDHSFEMSIPVPIPPTYQGLSEEEAVEAKKDFYYKLGFYVFVLTGEERLDPLYLYQLFGGGGSRRGVDGNGGGGLEDGTNSSQMIRYATGGRLAIQIAEVRDKIFGLFGYDELLVRKCELEGLNVRSGELEERRRKIKGFDKKLSEGDKRLKRAKDFGSRRWLYSSVVRERLDITADSHSDIEEYGLSLPLTILAKGIMNAIGGCPAQLNGSMWQFYGVKNYKAYGGSYFGASATRRRFFDLNSVGRTWKDNIIWVKGNCLQRDDEEPLDLRFRTVNQSVKSKVERKESLLDEVAEEETKLKLVLEGLDSAQPNPAMPSKIDLKYPKKWMLKALPTSGTTGSAEVTKDKRGRVKPAGESGEKVTEGRSAAMDDLKEVEERARLAVLHGEEDMSKMLKASHAVTIGQLQVETKANLDGMVKELDRLGCHLMLKGYSEEDMDTIKADTYAEEEDEEEAEAVGIVDGLDGISLQTVELDSSHSRKDDVLMCNREFAEQFDKMVEANEKIEDQYVKAYFKLVEVTQAVSDFTLQVEGKDAEINTVLKELAEVTEHTEKLQSRVDALAVKVSLSGRIRELESDVSCIQGHVQKGNTNLRECQHKLDAALIREKVLEGEIKAKESLVKRKEELLKDILAREELNAEIRRLRARVVDLEAMHLAESTKYTKKLEENIIYHAKVDVEMT